LRNLTLYVSTPINPTDVTNKAYVDAQIAGNTGGSDVSFLAKKEFDGDLKNDEGSRTTTGTLATITASAGQDLYLALASCLQITASAAAGSATIELQINGTARETARFATDADTSQIRPTAPYTFVSKGFMVAPTQVIRLEVTAIANATVEGNLSAFEVDTGTDPTA